MADSPAATSGHEGHDPELIAALLDRDLPPDERAFGEARIAACVACAVLHADLLGLAQAYLGLATPGRPRDFTLTSATAAMLAQQAAGEPVRAGARLIGEMTDSRPRHAAHDPLLIANLIDRSVSDSERARAEELMASCRDCALLFDDLVAISAATRALPVPARQRDFTLTYADAERLRVRGWRRLLAAIGSSRDVFSRPLAMGLTTLGIAGLLVATIPGALTGQGSSTAALSTVGSAADGASRGAGANPEALSGEASAAPSAAPAPAAAAAAPEGPNDQSQEPDKLAVGGEESPPPYEPGGPGGVVRTFYSEEQPRNWPGRIGSLLLLAGLALFGLRWMARRFGDG